MNEHVGDAFEDLRRSRKRFGMTFSEGGSCPCVIVKDGAIRIIGTSLLNDGRYELVECRNDDDAQAEEGPTAQDVIDALRVALMAQKDPTEVVNCLLEFAPETDGNRGIDLLLRLISEATLKASLTDG